MGDNTFIKCRHCVKCFDNINLRQKHELSCATDKCPVCSKWMKKINLNRHLTTVHIHEDLLYSCEKCPYITQRKDHLNVHKCKVTEFTCSECHKCFILMPIILVILFNKQIKLIIYLISYVKSN